MMVNFSESNHPIFRDSSAFERREFRSKGHGEKSVHFKGSDENIELRLRTVISANQHSVYGDVADLCNELSEDFRASGKPEAPDHLETMKIPPGRLLQKLIPMHSNGETWCKTMSENLNNCQKTRNYPNSALMRVRSLSRKDSTSTLLIRNKDNRCKIYAEKTRCHEKKKGLVEEDGSASIQESVQS